MKIISEINEIKSVLKKESSIGFVPTMGALHQGHISLIKQSKKENKTTVVSIFLNATQFNNKEDLEKYPTSLSQDITLLEKQEVDYLFLPDYPSIYPDNYNYRVVEDKVSSTLCGKSRPGHFDGVLTVVLKLFNIIKPHRAYFGEKDYQQYKLIKGMVDALFLDVELISCPIIRDQEGLALSSRNNRLSSQGLLKAHTFARVFSQKKSISEIERELSNENIKIDYLEEWSERRFAAVEIENVRLIDNVRK